MSLSVVEEIDAGRAIASELDSCHRCTSQYSDVWLVHDRVHVGTEDRLSFSVAHCFINKRASSHPFHHSSVRIRESFETHRFSAFQQRHGERVRVCCGLHVHRAMCATVIRIGTSSPRLNTAAVKIQNGYVTPRWIVRFRCIEIPIGSVSTRPCRNIDAGPSSKNLAHRVANRSSIEIWIGLSYEAPIQFSAERHGPTVWIHDQIFFICAPSLKQEHVCIRIGRESGSHDTTRCACPAYDEVVTRLQVGGELLLIKTHS